MEYNCIYGHTYILYKSLNKTMKCAIPDDNNTDKPVYITENGIADDSDTRRAKFIEDHLLVLNKMISEGMNIKGYFYWSLIDNFEWAHGFEKRFGLYYVDYSTQERTLREGSRKYIEIMEKSRE